MAGSAFQVWYAQEVRMYALVTLAVLIAVYALVPAWQQGGVGAWVVCSGALLAALYLDYSAFYVYSALVISFMVVGRRRAPIRRPFVVKSMLRRARRRLTRTSRAVIRHRNCAQLSAQSWRLGLRDCVDGGHGGGDAVGDVY